MLCLGLVAVLMSAGLSAFVIDCYLRINYALPPLPDLFNALACALCLLANLLTDRVNVPSTPFTHSLATGAIYWLPGLASLFVYRYLRVQRIRDEMALK